MNKKTIFIIYALFLVMLMYQSFQKAAAPIPPQIRMIADASSYTLPTTPIISLINDSPSSVTVDTCRDIQVVANGIQKTTLPEELCRVVDAPAQSTVVLIGATPTDIEVFQEKFSDIPDVDLRWTYSQPESDVTSEMSFSIGKAGWIRLFFRTVFYDPVYNLFAALIVAIPGHSLGWAIITMTLIIRLALLVPQQKSLVSQRKMQAIQPKIKHLQDKHK